MKKYIKPAIVEIDIENESILAASTREGLMEGETGSQGANDFELDWDEE